MTTTVTSASDEGTNSTHSRPPGRSARRIPPVDGEESPLSARFFLSSPGANGNALQVGREFSSEGEARVEALKAGLTYYSVREWRPVADFAGKNPELKREAVARKAGSHAPE